MLFWQFGFYAYAVLFMSKLTGHRSEWIEPPLVHSRQEKECFHSAPTCCWNNKQLAYYSTGEGSSNENVPSGLPQPPGPQILARNADESTVRYSYDTPLWMGYCEQFDANSKKVAGRNSVESCYGKTEKRSSLFDGRSERILPKNKHSRDCHPECT